MVGEWHTYRFSIVTTPSGDAAPDGVALKGYLDGVLKVSAADAPATYAAGPLPSAFAPSRPTSTT